MSLLTLEAALLLPYFAIEAINVGLFAATVCALLLLIAPGEPLVGISLYSALGLVEGAGSDAAPQLNATTSNQALAYGTLAQAGNIGNLCATQLLQFLFNFSSIIAMITLVAMCYITAICIHVSCSLFSCSENPSEHPGASYFYPVDKQPVSSVLIS